MTTVTCAIIENEGKILIARRAAGQKLGGKWEFPGGKLDKNESPEECLRRELIEELNLPVSVESIFEVIHHHYNWGSVLLLAYHCTALSDQIENLQVAEHRYVPIEQLRITLGPLEGRRFGLTLRVVF